MARVLLAHPDFGFADELSRALEQAGHEVLHAPDGHAAVRLAVLQRPDLVVMAVELPGPDGISVCDHLRSKPALGSLPVMLLASTVPDEVLHQHASGPSRAHDYVRMPLNAAALMARIAYFLPAAAAPAQEVSSVLELVDADLIEVAPPAAPAAEPWPVASAGAPAPPALAPSFSTLPIEPAAPDASPAAGPQNLASTAVMDEGREEIPLPLATPLGPAPGAPASGDPRIRAEIARLEAERVALAEQLAAAEREVLALREHVLERDRALARLRGPGLPPERARLDSGFHHYDADASGAFPTGPGGDDHR
ncbi:MAG: response regulator [Deltaproteobacteria bacterium]|nr:response regulator [Deltaproteobacteria bacterium]